LQWVIQLNSILEIDKKTLVAKLTADDNPIINRIKEKLLKQELFNEEERAILKDLEHFLSNEEL
jgi:hypothetical protein